MPEVYWSTRRKQYRNLCELCTRIDGAISLITMISFSNNLYFICVQLLRSLKWVYTSVMVYNLVRLLNNIWQFSLRLLIPHCSKMPSLVHVVYFYFSFFFLIGRTLAVSLYSASINDESRKPLRVLRCVPKESWCIEVKRFSEDISTDLVALSGMKFFYLTRKMVLSVSSEQLCIPVVCPWSVTCTATSPIASSLFLHSHLVPADGLSGLRCETWRLLVFFTVFASLCDDFDVTFFLLCAIRFLIFVYALFVVCFQIGLLFDIHEYLLTIFKLHN